MAKYCGDCGIELDDNDLFCRKCGSKQGEEIGNDLLSEFKYGSGDDSDEFLDEMDYRDEISDVIINYAKPCNLTITTRTNMKPKQIQNAMKFCDDRFSVTDIIILMDNTIMSNMKEGMVFTYDSAYKISDGALIFKVKYNQIAKIEQSRDMSMRMAYVPTIKITLINNRVVELRCGKDDSSHYKISKMWILFSEICKCINQYREDNTKIIVVNPEVGANPYSKVNDAMNSSIKQTSSLFSWGQVNEDL